MAKPNVTFEELVAYALGELAPEAMQRLEGLLADSPEHAETAERLRRAVAAARSDDSVAPPVEVLRAAQALFRERQARQRGSGWLENLRRIVAELVYDSRPAAALAGTRGAACTYQLAFESELADVDLEVDLDIEAETQHREPRIRLRGQVSPHGPGRACAVALAPTGTWKPVESTVPDADGWFELTGRKGRFDLLVSFEEAMLVLPRIEVE